uniref:Uncharacterized protein n=1 Tax=Mesorhizobium plurifarium TaxID=69974 RepID=I2AWI8_MESPL|nr:hypothetical protein [Mesorhizobium plurifarium]
MVELDVVRYRREGPREHPNNGDREQI